MATITKECEMATIKKEREMATTTKERVSRLEERYEHLATEANLHAFEARLVKWMIGVMIGGIVAAAVVASAVVAIVSAVARLLN